MADASHQLPAILLVEDEPDILNLLHLCLTRWAPGYNILLARSSSAALEVFDARPVALVITDYNMPGMNGLQLTSAIKMRTRATSVVLITAYPSPTLHQRALDRGVDYYLPKPIHFDLLEQVVRAVLAQSADIS